MTSFREDPERPGTGTREMRPVRSTRTTCVASCAANPDAVARKAKWARSMTEGKLSSGDMLPCRAEGAPCGSHVPPRATGAQIADTAILKSQRGVAEDVIVDCPPTVIQRVRRK